MLTVFETRTYRVQRDPSGGLILRRREDDTTRFFQPGDDEARFMRELEGAAEAEAAGRPYGPDELFADYF